MWPGAARFCLTGERARNMAITLHRPFFKSDDQSPPGREEADHDPHLGKSSKFQRTFPFQRIPASFAQTRNTYRRNIMSQKPLSFNC